jgi:hypothetical protein
MMDATRSTSRRQGPLIGPLTVVPLARPQPLFPLFGEAECENRLQRWEGRLEVYE